MRGRGVYGEECDGGVVWSKGRLMKYLKGDLLLRGKLSFDRVE